MRSMAADYPQRCSQDEEPPARRQNRPRLAFSGDVDPATTTDTRYRDISNQAPARSVRITAPRGNGRSAHLPYLAADGGRLVDAVSADG